MRAIWSMAIKDLRLLSRDKMALFFIICFPVLMGLFFGMIGGSFGKGPSENSIRVGVVDLDGSDMARLFIDKLGEHGAVNVTPIEHDAARAAVLKGELTAYLVVPEGFGATAGMFWTKTPALELGVDPSRAAAGGMIQGYVMQAVGGLMQKRFSNPASMRPQIRRLADDLDQDENASPAQHAVLRAFMGTLDTFMGSLEQFNTEMDAIDGGAGAPMKFVTIETVDVVRPPSKRAQLTAKLRSKWDIPFPAAMLWGVMACVAGFAISIVRERAEGTLVRLQVAPISRTHVLAGKATACFLATLSVIAFMTVLGLLLGIQLARPDLLVLASLSIAVCFVGLMMLMAVLGKTEEAVGGAGWAIIVVLCMFGGGMIPLVFMPSFMLRISNFSPVKWGVYALEGAIWRDFTLTEMLVPCAILVGIGVASFTIGARVFARQSTA